MQGFNMGRYRPPSALDPALSAAPSSAQKQSHPLGARAGKLPQGILTVRFEMPFAIWCSTCPSHSSSKLIGQGVRFNAEKKRVGSYYSTPLWSFRVKHTACGGWIEIRTDPKNSEYLVTEGARRRDTGDDAAVGAREGATVLLGEAEKRRLDAIEALEGRVDDKKRAKTEAQRLEELRSLRDRDWRDPDAQNSKLRAAFRVGRKTRERNAFVTERLQDKMSLGIELLDETDEDRRRAGLVDFEPGGADTADAAALRATSKPLFELAEPNSPKDAGSKRQALLKTLQSNTRAAFDPFSVKNSANKTRPLRAIAGVKRKLDKEPEGASSEANESLSTSKMVHASVDDSTADMVHGTTTDGSKARLETLLAAYESD